MSINHNRIKVADLEKNQPNKILTTNDIGELEFSDINNIKIDTYNALDYTLEGKALDARQGKILKESIDTSLSVKENISNKVQNIETNKNLSSAFPSVKAIYNWATGLFKTWALDIENISEISYTLNISNINKRTVFTSANPVTFTIPDDSLISIPLGAKKELTQRNSGIVTIGGMGITFVTNSSLTMVKGETRILTKIDTNTWTIEGESPLVKNTNRTCYINSFSGDNNTGIIGDIKKPFLNTEGAIAALPIDDGTTYIFIYTNYGSHVMSQIPERNITFEGITPYGSASGFDGSSNWVTLDFTTLGNTASNILISGNVYTTIKKNITFRNLVLSSLYTENQGFHNNNTRLFFDNVNISFSGRGISNYLFHTWDIKGNINILELKTGLAYVFLKLSPKYSELKISELKLVSGTQYLIRETSYMKISIYKTTGSGTIWLNILGSELYFDLYNFNHTGSVNLANQGSNSNIFNFNNSAFFSTGIVSTGESQGIITGNLRNTNTVSLTQGYERNGSVLIFLNFTGRIFLFKNNITVPYHFINCNLTCATALIDLYNNQNNDVIKFIGTNIIKQDTAGQLILNATIPMIIEKRGTIFSNATSLGANIIINNTTPNSY